MTIPDGGLLLLTHHKCASSWLLIWLAKLCELNQLRLNSNYIGLCPYDDLCQVNAFVNAKYDRIPLHHRGPILHIIRNPLNILQSAYYSHLKTHPSYDWPELRTQRAKLEACDKEAGMELTLSFLEHETFYEDTPGPLRALSEWNYGDPRIITIRMEDLVAQPQKVLAPHFKNDRILSSWHLPSDDDFTFEKFASGRKKGEIDDSSHYRVGDPEAWQSELSTAMVEKIYDRYGALMARFYPEARSATREQTCGVAERQ